MTSSSKDKVILSPNHSSPGPRDKFLLTPSHAAELMTMPPEWNDGSKKRRRSTMHSYTLAVYQGLPNDERVRDGVRSMTSYRAAKNLLSVSFGFMLIYTGFISLQSLHSTLHPKDGLGLVSLSIIYGTTVLSCFLAPWLINRLTLKWTVVLAFATFILYFGANFYPQHVLILPISVLLGVVTGPMWSAQATYITTLALMYAQHRKIELEDIINRFTGVFFGLFRCSQVWGNLISTVILSQNATDTTTTITTTTDSTHNFNYSDNNIQIKKTVIIPVSTRQNDEFHHQNPLLLFSSSNISSSSVLSSSSSSSLSSSPSSSSSSPSSSAILLSSTTTTTPTTTTYSPYSTFYNRDISHCGANTCQRALNLLTSSSSLTIVDNGGGGTNYDAGDSIPHQTRYLLLTAYLACGVMAVIIIIVLVDHLHVGKNEADPEFSQNSRELCMSSVKMLRDTKCILLAPMVLFIGLQQAFMFGDFTKAYVNCTLGVDKIGPILVCFGTVSAGISLAIGYVSRHIKRFAFIAAGATFNVGLLIVLWLWRPREQDVPNFYVVSACLGLCDAIWQTQTYTLFGILFSHKQEAAFAAHRMFLACGSAMAFGYSYFLCVETKVFILGGILFVSLGAYSVIEMKVQFQSQHIEDIVAL